MNNVPEQPCPYCSSEYSKIYHGGVCPKVKSYEYYPDGTIKKVEFKDIRNPWHDTLSNFVHFGVQC